LVIAHRGASGHRPEHTLAAYQLAIVQGADFLELDLVATRDGELIARHENLLAELPLDDDGRIASTALDADGNPLPVWATTDVAERVEFRDRLTVKVVDGRPRGGWFTEDFTLAELKSLRARERMPGLRPQNRLYDDTESIPTLAEVIALVGQPSNRAVGLYIELKHPTYFLYEGLRLDGESISIDLADRLLATLEAQAYTEPQRLYIQCFEVEPLLVLHRQLELRGMPIPLIQLFGDITNTNYRARPYDMVYHGRDHDGFVERYGELAKLLGNSVAGDVSYAELARPEVLEFLERSYASGIGPTKHNVLPVRWLETGDADGGGRLSRRAELVDTSSEFASSALSLGLEVHPYTLRQEEPFLLRERGRTVPVAEEALRLLRAGATGFFIDQPSEGRMAVASYLNSSDQKTGRIFRHTESETARSGEEHH
jgi:glycerophosphoryl diester phosphodiesterase